MKNLFLILLGIFLLIQLSVYSQDTIQNNIIEYDSISYYIMTDTIIDTLMTVDLSPIVVKKYNEIYFGFDKKQSEYLYNSLMQRDFYKSSYIEKTVDFNNIVLLYDNEIIHLKEQLKIQKKIMLTQDTIIYEKSQEITDKETIYIKKIKKEKRKTFIVTSGGIIIIALTFLILI